MKKQFDLIDKKKFLVKIHDIYYQCEGRQHFLKYICYYYYIVLFAGILKCVFLQYVTKKLLNKVFL